MNLRLLFLVLGLGGVSVAAALLVGPYPLPWHTVVAALTGSEGNIAAVVVDLRLARIVLALGCGAALGVAGSVFQTLLGNPLADPFTLGVSSGAALGATVAIVLGISGPLALPLASLLGAACALGLVLSACLAGGSLSQETLILAGIVVSTFLAACIALTKALHEDSVSAIVFWLLGSLQNRSWPHVQLLLPLGIPALGGILMAAKTLDVLALGGESAHCLGVSVPRARGMLLTAAAALTAASVAVCGIIGFVGLVVPHVARRLVGGRHGACVPVSAVLGGLVLLWADTVARALLPHGAELPVGVITALGGAPALGAILLWHQRQS
jgi:iron complex transport system permease protein